MSKSDYIVERFEHNGHRISIYTDQVPESPREWDNLGTMACWHSRYNLGDEQPAESYREWIRYLAANTVGADDPDAIPDEHVERILDKHFVMLSLYLYDHSGITMNTSGFSCPWDSGQVGVIYVSRNKIIEEYGDDTVESREKAEKCLRQEVETYDDYLTGSVYGYEVEKHVDADCDEGDECDDDDCAHWEHVDSCWGFYGLDYCKEQANECCEPHQLESDVKSCESTATAR